MRLEIHDEIDNLDYEVFVRQPNWRISRYIIANRELILQAEEKNIEKLTDVLDDILRPSIIKWRLMNGKEPTAEDYKEDVDEMPSNVCMVVSAFLIKASQRVAELRIKKEKN